MASARRSLLAQVVKDADAERLSYAIIGGWAVQAHTHSRTVDPKDVDMVVATRTPKDVMAAMEARGYAIIGTQVHPATHEPEIARLSVPGHADGTPNGVDIFFSGLGVERDVVDSAQRMQPYEGLEAPVAALGPMCAMKLMSAEAPDRRARDMRDLEELVALEDPRSAKQAAVLYDKLLEHQKMREAADRSALDLEGLPQGAWAQPLVFPGLGVLSMERVERDAAMIKVDQPTDQELLREVHRVADKRLGELQETKAGETTHQYETVPAGKRPLEQDKHEPEPEKDD